MYGHFIITSRNLYSNRWYFTALEVAVQAPGWHCSEAAWSSRSDFLDDGLGVANDYDLIPQFMRSLTNCGLGNLKKYKKRHLRQKNYLLIQPFKNPWKCTARHIATATEILNAE